MFSIASEDRMGRSGRPHITCACASSRRLFHSIRRLRTHLALGITLNDERPPFAPRVGHIRSWSFANYKKDGLACLSQVSTIVAQYIWSFGVPPCAQNVSGVWRGFVPCCVPSSSLHRYGNASTQGSPRCDGSFRAHIMRNVSVRPPPVSLWRRPN